MALRLVRSSQLVGRITAARNVMPLRGGGGGPLAPPKAPSSPLPEEDELTWDDGTGNPEPCLDDFTGISDYGALGMAAAAFGTLYIIGRISFALKPEERVPYAPRQFPYDLDSIIHPTKGGAQ